jgi:hypothetical protein
VHAANLARKTLAVKEACTRPKEVLHRAYFPPASRLPMSRLPYRGRVPAGV